MNNSQTPPAVAGPLLSDGLGPLPKPDRPNVWGGCYSKETLQAERQRCYELGAARQRLLITGQQLDAMLRAKSGPNV
jgi:hypothetical protein